MNYAQSWGVVHMNAPAAHAAGVRGQTVRVVHCDSGLDFSHPAFATTNIVGSRNCIAPGTPADDDHGHGTISFGPLAAAIGSGPGVSGFAPDCEFYIAKVLNENASAPGWVGPLRGLEYCIELTEGGTIPVVSIHPYGSLSQYTAIQAAYQAAADAGVILCCMGGNSGASSTGFSRVTYPGRYPFSIAVAYMRPNGDLGGDSSVGPEIDFIAPGSYVWTTKIGGGYGESHGSTMSCPHVGGLIAMALQQGVSPANLYNELKASTESPTTHTPERGWGTPDTIRMLGPFAPVEPPEPTGELVMRYVKMVSLNAHDGGPHAHAAEINLLDENGTPLDRSGWSVSADSFQPGREPEQAIDGVVSTASYWNTEWDPNDPPHPHEYIIDMGQNFAVSGLNYAAVVVGGSTIKDYEVYGSTDGVNWGVPLARGAFAATMDVQEVEFPNIENLNERVFNLENRVDALEAV